MKSTSILDNYLTVAQTKAYEKLDETAQKVCQRRNAQKRNTFYMGPER